MSDHHFWLSDEQFARMQPLLPDKPRGVPRVDDRRVISGIVHVIRNGLMWRDAPAVYGPHKTLYNRFVRWSRAGVFDRIFAALAAGSDATGDREQMRSRRAGRAQRCREHVTHARQALPHTRRHLPAVATLAMTSPALTCDFIAASNASLPILKYSTNWAAI